MKVPRPAAAIGSAIDGAEGGTSQAISSVESGLELSGFLASHSNADRSPLLRSISRGDGMSGNGFNAA